ncbi:MAG: hypothetical protein RL167_42 [Actinomycetota bacterium]|jgi:putative PIN family toxin of toxin-antitoxin system
MSADLKVVFDINVFIDAFVGKNSTFPLIEQVPPQTSNAAADCLSLAFDGEHFQLFASPHIVQNLIRVLRNQFGLSDALVASIAEAAIEIVHMSGGSIIEPRRHVGDVKDFEDNLILDLVVATDSLVAVSSDKDLLDMNPWKGRLILKPRKFVQRLINRTAI